MNYKLHILDIHHTERAIDTIAVPWETDYAALVPRFTGSLSAISSALIIYIILRSQTRLSSIYHRIMFGMSIADVLSSTAMALTSLPMPSHMPKEEEFGYHWAGTRLGNQYTCDAQGFFATFGMVCMFNYNAMLCVYYACAIAFTMRERNIKRSVEPIIHGLPLVIGLGFAITPLFYEMYNPGISGFAWCGPQPYPDEECTIDHWEEKCIRGNAHVKKILQILISIIIMSDFACIVISLILVIAKVIQTDHVMVQISKIYRDCGNSEMEKVLERHRNTKAVILQASSYIAAFVLGIMPPALLSIGAIQSSGQNGHEVADCFEKITLVLLPLQGFFNFVIFVSHKVYNYRRVHCDVGIGRVIQLLFCTSAHDPCFISRISIVKQYHDDMEEQGQEEEGEIVVENNKEERTDAPIGVVKSSTSVVYQLDVHDESNDQQHQQEEQLHYRLSFMKKNTHDDDGAALLNVIMIGHHCNLAEQQQQQQQQDGIRPTMLDTHQEEEAPMMTSNRVAGSCPGRDFSNPRTITRTSDWHAGGSIMGGDDGLLSFPSFSSFSSPRRSSEGSGEKTTSNNNTTRSSRYSDMMLSLFDDNDEKETTMMEKNKNIRHYYK